MRLHKLVKTLPKAELHVHLEGAIDPNTAIKLAYKYSHLGFVEKIEQLSVLSTQTKWPPVWTAREVFMLEHLKAHYLDLVKTTAPSTAGSPPPAPRKLSSNR